MKKGMSILTALVLGFAFWFGQFAQAGSVTFELDFTFSGGADPSGTAPWLTILIDDHGSAGSVDVHFTSNLITTDEFISEIYLNLNPAIEATDPLFMVGTPGGTVIYNDLQLGIDAFKAGGDGRYDLWFKYDVASGTDRFGDTLGDTSDAGFLFPGLVYSDFNFSSSPAGGHGPFLAAAHVQGIQPNCSAWIAPNLNGGAGAGDCVTTVPEPATSVLLLSGLVMVGLANRKRERQKRRSSRL